MTAPIVFVLLTAVVAADATEIVVSSGAFARRDTPVEVVVEVDRLAQSGVNLTADPWPKPIALQEQHDGRPFGAPTVAEVSKPVAHQATLTFILPGATPARADRRFSIVPKALDSPPIPWTLSDPSAGTLDLKNRGRPVFRYNLKPVANPKFPKVPARAAYLHPAQAPSGAVITGDFSTAHPHHRGFFLAYAKTQSGTLHPDFWNIHNGTGLIVFDRLEQDQVGPVTAGISARHRWEATGGGTVLVENWRIRAFDIPGSPYWLFDLTSTQQAIGKPLELPPYRYGGMAYRGPDPFLKGTLDVLTSAGLGRKTGDQKPARWVDLTGPVVEGSARYGGALILDHPANPHHPTPARIHPTSLPFFAFTPSHDEALVIAIDRPTVFRYRIMLHDGRPDAALDDQLWHDFADPPRVSVEPGR